MLNKIYRLRTYVSLPNIDKDATPLVIDQLKKTKDNKEFLDTMNRGGA